MTKALAAILLSLLLLLAGCSTETGDQPGPGDPTGSVVNDPTDGAGTETFALDEVAEFDDGLLVEVAGTVATKAEVDYRGAEGNSHEIVVVSVRIENGTAQEFPAAGVVVTASYGDEVPAPLVTDPAGELQQGFSGVVPVGDEAVAPLGFAVPFSAVRRVKVTVDRGDDLFAPVSFSGPVERG